MTRSLTFNHRECRPHELADLHRWQCPAVKRNRAQQDSRAVAHSIRQREAPRIDNIRLLVPLPALAVTEQ